MSKYKIEYLPINQVKLNDKNPRFIKDGEFKKLVKSLRECPQLFDARPLLCSDRTGELIILGGNMRYRAALELRWDKVPVIIMAGLTEAQEKEIIIKDNGAFGEWDMKVLAADWAELPLDDWGVQLIDNWQDDCKEAIEDDFDADAAVAEITEPTSKTGDVWLLGRHRVMCGDSTKKEDVERLMGGGMADITITSPPYWVGFAYENENEKTEIIRHINNVSSNVAMVTRGRIVINTGNISSITTAEKITGKKQPALLIDWWIEALNRKNYLLRHIRVWAKNGGIQPSRANDKIDMHWEYLATFTEEEQTAGFVSTFRNATDNTGINKNTPPWAVRGVWTDIQGNARATGHVAAYPIAIPGRYLQMYTKQEATLYEPYCGSGTTLIAAEQLNRICYGMEIDPVYCDVIIKRWETLTGKKAVLEGV